MLVHATDPVIPSGVPLRPAPTLACAGHNSISRLQPISTTMADRQTLSNIRDYRGQYRPTGNTILPRPSPIQTGAGEMAEPSTLAQTAINVANTDVVRTLPPQPSNSQPIPHPSPGHVRWLQPRGPVSILTAVPNHLQLIPATVLNGCHQSLFRHQLFEEDGIRMVQARHIGR